MLYIIIFILGISFILYTLLGGADFGAGIVETFAGKKGEKIVSRAMAPVWEANHVWLILAIVIIFTGFPQVYATISLSLHIPLMIVLMGIVLRGSAFTFRNHDTGHPTTHKYFTIFFKTASFITPLFLGITLGAFIWGKISLEPAGNFYQRFIMPWFNIFCLSIGLFTSALFAFIAATFLVGETIQTPEQKKYTRLSKIFMGLTYLLGIIVFIIAELGNHSLLNDFLHSTPSLIAFGVVVLLIPAIFYLYSHPNIIYLRSVIALQVTFIILGWFAMQYPVLIFEKNGNHLSFINTQAPYATLYQLFIALIVGLVLIVPAFIFLFKIFKKSKNHPVITEDF